MTTETITTTERSLIGCLLSDCQESTLISVREVGLTPDSFLDYSMGAIFGLLCEKTRHGTIPDLNTISQIADKRTIETIGGILGLNRIVDSACFPSHAAHHAKEVYRSALSRKSSGVLQKWSRVMAETNEPEVDLASAQAELHQLQTVGIQKRVVRQVAEFREDKIRQWRDAVGRGYVGIPSSLSDINKYLGGYRPGVMCVLGGYRGQGKSTLARQDALGISQKGYRVLLCSMEDPGDIAAAGMAGNYSNRSVFHLDTGADDPSHIDQIEKDWADMSGLPLHIASGTMRIEDIENAVMIHNARHGIDFLIIDHIQFIVPYKLPGLDRNGTVATYSQRIVAMLNKYQMPGLVLSQLSREGEKDKRKPVLSDLRDSGCIEQDARQVMLLYFDAQDRRHRLEIAKNNFGISSKTFVMEREDGRQRFKMIGEE